MADNHPERYSGEASDESRESRRARLLGRVLILSGLVVVGFGIYPPFAMPYVCGPSPPLPPPICYYRQSFQFGSLFFVGLAALVLGIVLVLWARHVDEM